MRRIILALVGTLLIAGLLVESAAAQGFRRGAGLARPVAPMNAFVPFRGGFGTPFNTGFLAPLPTMTRATTGAFNPRTGAFAPSFGSPFVLSQRHGFEPLRGNFTPTPTGRFNLSVREAFNPFTNSFVPSNFGNIVVRERGNFTPNAGPFTHATTGSVNLFNGNFAPRTSGASTLFSPGQFVSSRGVFVPSTFGNFSLLTREAFNPATNSFRPSPNGNFAFQVRGNFIPGASPTSVALATGTPFGNSGFFSPFSSGFFSPAFNNPLGQTFRNAIVRQNALLTSQQFNPYLSTQNFNPYQFYNPYSYGNPYWTMGYGGYGGYGIPYAAGYYGGGYGGYGGGYGGGNYGGGYGAGMSPYASNQFANPIPAQAPAVQQNNDQSVVSAFGIPSDANGIAWPLAFRLMPPDQKTNLLDPLQAELQAAATQAATGNPSPAVLRRAKQNLDDLGVWLRSHRNSMAEGTYRDADQFLRKLDGVLRTLQAAS